MPRPLTDTEHVIYQIQKETEKRGRAVTLAQVAAVSARPRERIEEAFKSLFEDGLIGAIDSPEWMKGRPTRYFYLKHKWTEPELSISTPPHLLVPTQEPSEISESPLGETEPERDPVEELLGMNTDLPKFLIVGPKMVALIEYKYNRGLDTEKRKEFIEDIAKTYRLELRDAYNYWRRLTNAAYDEYWTEYGIDVVTVKRTDGTPDRRYGGGTGQVYTVRFDTADNWQNKEETQRKEQEYMIKTYLENNPSRNEDFARELFDFPEPNPDLPPMHLFDKHYSTITRP